MLKTSYLYLGTTPETMPTIGLEIVASGALAARRFDHTKHLGDGHVTLMYGHMPGIGFGGVDYARETPKYPPYLLAGGRLALGYEECRIVGVERGFDGRTIIAKLESEYVQTVMRKLYANDEFCRGHPEYKGPWKLNDDLWGKRELHLTVVRDFDVSTLNPLPPVFDRLVGRTVRVHGLFERVVFVDDKGARIEFQNEFFACGPDSDVRVDGPGGDDDSSDDEFY